MPGDPLAIAYAYAIDDCPGVTLFVGRPPGRVRPALWIEQEGQVVILAQFHGDKHALVARNFLDSMIGQINRVIQFYADQNDNGDRL